MIFVTIGTQEPFDRFIKIIDDVAPLIDDEIIAQVSNCSFTPQNIKTIKFIAPDEFNDIFMKARLIVSHAGMGTIISALQKHKPIIVFPRIAALGEHRNEHQLATARKFKEMGKIYVAMDESELRKLIVSKNLKCLSSIGETASPELIKSIEDFIG